MTSGLKAQGVKYLVALPVSMFVFHFLVGYPLTSWLLKKECKRLVNEFNSLSASQKNSVARLSNDDDLQSKHFSIFHNNIALPPLFSKSFLSNSFK